MHFFHSLAYWIQTNKPCKTKTTVLVYNLKLSLLVCLFACHLCPTWVYFAHKQTLVLLMKGCKIWNCASEACRDLFVIMTCLLWHGTSVFAVSSEGLLQLSRLFTTSKKTYILFRIFHSYVIHYTRWMWMLLYRLYITYQKGTNCRL